MDLTVCPARIGWARPARSAPWTPARGNDRRLVGPGNASRTMFYNLRGHWDAKNLTSLHSREHAARVRAGEEVGEVNTTLGLSGVPPEAATAGGALRTNVRTSRSREKHPAPVAFSFKCRRPLASKQRLITSVAWQIGARVASSSVFISGAVVQWLRDGLKPTHRRGGGPAHGVRATRRRGYRPGFLGSAPHWDATPRRRARLTLTPPPRTSPAPRRRHRLPGRDLLDACMPTPAKP